MVGSVASLHRVKERVLKSGCLDARVGRLLLNCPRQNWRKLFNQSRNNNRNNNRNNSRSPADFGQILG